MAKKPGKKITNWVFDEKGVALAIEVRMIVVKDRHDADDGKTKFVVVMPEYEIEDKDTDIDVLKTRVFEALAKSARPDWRKMLYVTITTKTGNPHDSYNDSKLAKSEIEFACGALEIATRPNGVKIYRWENNDNICEEWPETGKVKRYYGSGNRVGALIPDTPEHRRAIAEIAGGFEKIMERLNALLMPEEIEQTLSDVTARLMLTPADGK